MLRGLLVSLCALAIAPITTQRWSLVEIDRIGSLSEEEYALTHFESLAVAADGRVFVSQPMEGVIKVYGSDGKFIQTIGRRGEGPGEFLRPRQIGIIGDTLWVSDQAQRRITLLLLNGELVETLSIQSSPVRAVFWPTTPQAMLSDGSAFIEVMTGADLVATGEVQSVPMLRVDRAGVVLDTVAWRNMRNATLALQTPYSASFTSQPFADNSLYDVAGDGSKVAIVERVSPAGATEHSYHVAYVSAAGDTLLSKSIPFSARELNRHDVDAEIERLVDQYQNPNRPTRLFPTSAVARAAIKKALYLPEVRPPVSAVVTGSNGFSWLRREPVDGDLATWDVLDDQGNLIAVAQGDPGLRLLEVDDKLVWAQTWGEYDEPYVVILRIVKNGSDS